MGSQGVDVQLSEAALKCIPFAIEAKNQEKLAVIYNMWQQTLDNTKPPIKPLLVIKSNNKEPLAIIRLETFIELLQCQKRD